MTAALAAEFLLGTAAQADKLFFLAGLANAARRRHPALVGARG